MAYEKLEMLIDGEWTQGTSGKTEPVINPATEETLGELPHASSSDLDRALEASARGFKVWRNTTPHNRQQVINKAMALMTERADQIAETLTKEMGKPLAEAKVEVLYSRDVCLWYGEEGKRAYGRIIPARAPNTRQMVIKEPVGPVAAFTAWNFPATNAMRKIAGAVGAGCSIILKPSEETPGTAIAIARCFQDAGMPDGVINIVFGVPPEVSEHLLASRITRKVSFTGSVPVGKHLQKLAADTLKQCTMELGGHSPVLVFADADMDKAVNIMAGHKFRNAGQVCISPTRFYVENKVYDEFIDKFTQKAEAITVGYGMDAGVTMGPLIAPRRLDVMDDFIRDAKEHGAEITTGGERMGNQGHFFQPTVLRDVPEDAMIMNEEPFGPVAPMASFEDFDEVLDRANRLDFGLAAYAFTTDGARSQAISDQINTGLLAVNHQAVSMPETPFGGVNESGYGREGGIEGLEAYQRIKFVSEQGV